MYLMKNVFLTLSYFCILHAQCTGDIFNYTGDVLFTSRVTALREIHPFDGVNTLSFCSLQCLLHRGCTAIELCHQYGATICRICNHTEPSYTSNKGDVCRRFQWINTSSTTVEYSTQSYINSTTGNAINDGITATRTVHTVPDYNTQTTTHSNDNSVTVVSSVSDVCLNDCIEPSDIHGFCYRGKRNVTRTGKTCMKWSDKTPHDHDYDYPSLINNYCRNPDNVNVPRPWCYTTDPSTRYEYCDIPVCSSICLSSVIQLSNSTISCVEDSINATDPEGMCYRGTMNVTEQGKACQKWSTKFPHDHQYYETYPSVTENYCRNPDGSHVKRPWCYTADPSLRWDYCDVPVC